MAAHHRHQLGTSCSNWQALCGMQKRMHFNGLCLIKQLQRRINSYCCYDIQWSANNSSSWWINISGDGMGVLLPRQLLLRWSSPWIMMMKLQILTIRWSVEWLHYMVIRGEWRDVFYWPAAIQINIHHPRLLREFRMQIHIRETLCNASGSGLCSGQDEGSSNGNKTKSNSERNLWKRFLGFLLLLAHKLFVEVATVYISVHSKGLPL